MKKSLIYAAILAALFLISVNLSKKSDAIAANAQPHDTLEKPHPIISKKFKKKFNQAPSKDEVSLQILKTAQDFKPRVELKREIEKNNILKSRWLEQSNASDAAIALTLQNKGVNCQFNCERVQVDSMSLAGIKINTDAPYYKNEVTRGHFLAQTPAVYLE